MTEMRTTDLSYGADYWNTMDSGAGYQDSVMWEDLAFITRELLCTDPERGDITNEINLADFGCAFGFLVRHLRRRGVEAWGFDVSQHAIDNAAEDIRTFVRTFDLTDGFSSQHLAGWPFRRFVCLETMEHIPEDKVDVALEKIHKSLTRDGWGLFTICTSDRPGWETDPTHITIHPREWWEDRLELAGFSRDREREVWLKDNFWLFREHSGIFVVGR